MIHFVLLIACAVAIYLSCEWFVNAVEWLGERLNVGKMAVGTILAAFGTALPESVVTLVAVTTGATEEAKNIGVGAAMGARSHWPPSPTASPERCSSSSAARTARLSSPVEPARAWACRRRVRPSATRRT